MTRDEMRDELLADATRLANAARVTGLVHVCAWCDRVRDETGRPIGPNVTGADRDGICNECADVVQSTMERSAIAGREMIDAERAK